MYKVPHCPPAAEHLPTTHPHAGATSHAMLSILALRLTRPVSCLPRLPPNQVRGTGGLPPRSSSQRWLPRPNITQEAKGKESRRSQLRLLQGINEEGPGLRRMKRSGMHHLRKNTPLEKAVGGTRMMEGASFLLSLSRITERQLPISASQRDRCRQTPRPSPFVFVSLASRSTVGSLFSKRSGPQLLRGCRS